MRNGTIIVVLMTMLALNACVSSKIKGTWILDNERKERDGRISKIDQAAWYRFQKKGLYTAGNGWQQHTRGSWKIKKKKLILQSESGNTDRHEPYKVKVKGGKMFWDRQEDDVHTKLSFNQLETFPRGPRDKLIGVWLLKNALVDGKDMIAKFNPTGKFYAVFEWDGFFYVDQTAEGRMSGIYRVNGAIMEAEMFYNNKTKDRKQWKFSITDERLVFTSIAETEETILEFVRLPKVPD